MVANDEEGHDAAEAPTTASPSDRLAQRLSAHRTAALQIEVARHRRIALAALVHGMVQAVLQDRYHGHDLPLGVSLKVQDRLEGMVPDGPESPAAVAMHTLQEVAGEALPEDGAELFAVLMARSQDELVCPLAVCVASTVDVVTPRATQQQPGAELAQAVGLDMAAWWKPTAEGYFRHIAKSAILEAVNQYAPEHGTRLSKLKKGDIASEAERLAEVPAGCPPCSRSTTTPSRKAKGMHRPTLPRWKKRTPRPRETAARHRRTAPGLFARFQRPQQNRAVATFGQVATARARKCLARDTAKSAPADAGKIFDQAPPQ